jgi:hypothetical protein
MDRRHPCRQNHRVKLEIQKRNFSFSKMVALNGASVCSPDLERKKVAVAVNNEK